MTQSGTDLSVPSSSGSNNSNFSSTPVTRKENFLLTTGTFVKKNIQTKKHVLLPKDTFSDIGSSFAQAAITRLVGLQIVHGYSDGTYGPDRPITRAEYLAIVLRAFPATTPSTATASSFADVSVDWQVPIIETVYHMHIA